MLTLLKPTVDMTEVNDELEEARPSFKKWEDKLDRLSGLFDD